MKFNRAERLNLLKLKLLLNGELAVIQLPNYYPVKLCKEISICLLNSRLYGNYENAPEIGRVGKAFFESNESDEEIRSYHENAIEWIRELRECCAPNLTPIDKLRLDLDEIWPRGASVATMEGKKMFVGLARIFREGSCAEAHQDQLEWDSPNSKEANALVSQLTANVYLKVPPNGGELVIWPRSFTKDEYEKFRNPGSYGVTTTSLDCRPISIKPSVGELIMFNSRLIHAVSESVGGDRVSVSCFVGSCGEKDPIVFWS